MFSKGELPNLETIKMSITHHSIKSRIHFVCRTGAFLQSIGGPLVSLNSREYN